MIYEPHDYQKYATQRIIDMPKTGLFLDMGLGKTVITLTAVAELLSRQAVNRVLIIAPLRVAEATWSTESEKWEHTRHLRISKVLGSEDRRVGALGVRADIYIINRENVQWLVEYYKKRWPFDMVVIDELSSFKNHSSLRFKKLKSVLPKINRVVGLTATPAPNNLLDLWSQIYLLDGGERLGKFITHYRNEYFVPDRKNWQTGVIYSYAPKPDTKERVYAALSDLCVSMKACEHLNMPERINLTVSVKMPSEATLKYTKFEKDFILRLGESDVEAGSAAILTEKLSQMANGAVYDEKKKTQEIHSAKLDALEDLVESANGNPMLVFYTFHHDKKRITERLKAVSCPFGTIESYRDIERWNTGKIPVLLAHPASAGHGLNLQYGGATVVWFGLPWSLEYYEQGNGRIYRQGQKKRVVVHHLVTAGTVDEEIMAALDSKAVNQEQLLKAVKARIK